LNLLLSVVMLSAAGFAATGLDSATSLFSEHKYIEKVLCQRFGTLYEQKDDGAMNMLCTVWP
jgi:hypothetical protein